MADFNQHHKLLPGMKPRPEVVLLGKIAGEETLKSESKATFVFLRKCSNFTLNLEGKAAKVMCENCSNVRIVLSESLVSGTMEICNSKHVLIKLHQSCQIPIFQVDNSNDVTIEIDDKSSITSVYFQRSNTIVANVCGTEKIDIVTATPPESGIDGVEQFPQCVAHWNASYSGFLVEKIRRAGIYPLAEQREPYDSK